MGIPRHNAHMKIAKDIWSRAIVVATLSGQSMTAFVEEALERLVALRRKQHEPEAGSNGAHEGTD
jgi:hypothetical protein